MSRLVPPARLVAALALAGGALLALPRPQDQPPPPAVADVVLLGGKVYTAGPKAWAQAVAVRGDRVLAVGTDAEVRRHVGAATRVIPLGGRTVVPGINDAHDHVDPPFGVAVRTVDGPEPDPPLALVLDSLRAVAARTPRGEWLTAYVGMRVVDDTVGRLAALDRAAPDHPVLLRAPWGHFLMANGAALRAMGVTRASRDPLGGWYGRDATGALDGRLQENAALVHMRRLMHERLPARAFADAYRALADEALRHGITTVQDMSDGKGAADAVAALRAADVSIRVRLIGWPVDDGRGRRTTAEWDAAPRRIGARAVLSGRKYMLDGTPLERNALQRAPYADRDGWRGRANYPIDTVRAILAEALRSREPLMLHAVGDSTLRIVLGLMRELAPDSAWRARRVRIEHGDWLSGELVPVAERLGVVLVQNPAHLMLGPDLLRARYGRVPPGFQTLRDVERSTVRLALGSDGPRNPWLNVLFATTHANDPAQALTREQAVHAYTFGAAYAEGLEREKGTLQRGMLADLAVLSQDPFTVPAEALPATTSVLTMVGGRVAYDAGVLRTARR